MPAESLLISTRAKRSATCSAPGAMQHLQLHRVLQMLHRQRLLLPQRRHSMPLQPAAAAVTAARAAWGPCCCSRQRSLQGWAAGSWRGELRSSSSWTTGCQPCGWETATVCVSAVLETICCRLRCTTTAQACGAGKRGVVVLTPQAAPSDIFATTERLPEFLPVAAEGEFDEANTIFIGTHMHSLPATDSACRLRQLAHLSYVIAPSAHKAPCNAS